ncbi:hypothetical protein AB0N09_05295 [Streptomyces erythrochromogenes]|uniref:hypothetical protein n=1 Tax=Streptomyces erythrochromogenes TaxID=285574 RepID=UPI00344199CE
MASDESTRGGADSAEAPEDPVQHAIDWFNHDTTNTPQAIPRPAGPIAPGNLLTEAHRQAAFDDLLAPSASRLQDLVHAQATWLVRHMPSDHDPRALDSAQQAGRAWGILIATATDVLPSQEVITEVARQTRISLRAANEIPAQALKVSAAFNRADLLIPYDHAPDAVLVEDWNRLAACGPELPGAAARAADVLDLIAARVAGDDYDWMPTSAQQAAQLYDSVTRVQPLLTELTPLVPVRGQSDAGAAQERLLVLEQQGVLAAAATAAARARAVQQWAQEAAEPQLIRTRTVEAAAPGTRTLLVVNRVLAQADPDYRRSALVDIDPDRLAEIVQLIGQATARVPRPQQAQAGTRQQQNQHHQAGGHGGPGGNTPRL